LSFNLEFRLQLFHEQIQVGDLYAKALDVG